MVFSPLPSMFSPSKRGQAAPFSRIVPAVLLGCGLMLPAGAAIINLTNQTVAGVDQSTITNGSTTVVGGYLNGALFRRPVSADDSKGAGSGNFRDLYTVDSNSGFEEGYNRNNVMDSSMGAGFDPVITIGDLVEDSTGTAYIFVIDTNEAGNDPAKFISLDDFRVYVGGTSDPTTLPQDVAGVDTDLGLNVYSMNEGGQDNHVLIDYSLFGGSGNMDMFVFVPKAAFDGLDDNSLVYVYSKFGAYGEPGFDPSAGSEQVSIPGSSISGVVDPLVPIPEPSVALLAPLMGLLGFRRRR